MAEFTLYANTGYSRAETVIWALKMCEADYDVVRLEWEETKKPEYLALNPLGKVPTLVHKNEAITETAAIITYLADCHSDKGLIPATHSVERGLYYCWLMRAIHLEYATLDKIRGIENAPEQRRSIGYGDFDVLLDMLRHHLTGRNYIVGEQMTVLDGYYCGLLNFMTATQVLSLDPVLTSYAEHHGFAR